MHIFIFDRDMLFLFGLTNTQWYGNLSLMRKRILVSIIIYFCLVSHGLAFWVWTPAKKKWENPKYAVKQSPKLQFEYAMDFFNNGNYKRAVKEFKQLVNSYPKAAEAAEAQYYIGKSFEEWVRQDMKEQEELCKNKSKEPCAAKEKLWYRARYYQAYKAYQLTLEKYAFTKHFDEIIEREYDIADWFISDSKRKVLGMNFELEDPAVEILRKIVENSPYSKLAPKSLYSLGMHLKSKGYYQEAREELEKLTEKYPDSEWVEPAKYQIASCIAAVAPKAGYDQGLTQEAREKFEDFAKKNQEATLSETAQAQVDILKEKEAQSNFEIAQFYEKQKNFNSAKIYYQHIIDSYPKSDWAAKAKEALGLIDKK